MDQYQLYGFPLSANTHRVKLFLSLLGQRWTDIVVDLRSGEQHLPAFTSINSFQQVPVLKVGSADLVESHAILIFLAERSPAIVREQWWPSDPFERAEVARWLFVSAGDFHFGIGLARNERSFRIPSGGDDAAARALRAMRRLDAHLANRSWLALDRPTLADVSVYPFVAVAGEAGLEEACPKVARWVERLQGLNGFIPMPLLSDVIPAKAGAR